MNEILSITLRSMHQDISQLGSVAMNLSNALTPGYKREVVSAPAFAQLFQTMEATTTADASGSAPAVLIQTDARAGTLKSTGQSLDVALASNGYFEIETEQGPAYTRQGNFHVDDRGRLVNAKGNPVMGKGGEIFLNGANPVIDASGNVFEGGRVGKQLTHDPSSQPIAQLKVVQFDHPQNLERLGDGLVGSASEPALMNDSDIQIRQGYLENSNVSSMEEMVQLMQAMRHLESMQKIALGYDGLLETAIRKLGDLS